MKIHRLAVALRMRRSGSARLLLAAAMAAPVGLAVVGCAEKKEPVAAVEGEETGAVRRDLYVVRGEVLSLPEADRPGSELMVRHEAIPHFRGPGGRLGMNTMSMPFPTAADLSLEGVAVGDIVELTFEVDFDTGADRPTGYRATAVTVLPPETQLNWSPLPESEAADAEKE